MRASMPVLATTLIHDHHRLMDEGRFADVMGNYEFPLAVEIDGALQVYPNEAAFLQAMLAFRAALLAAGITAIVPRIAAVELPRHGRFRIWVDWDHWRGDALEKSARHSIYYCRQAAGRDRREIVEMMQCTAYLVDCSVPDMPVAQTA